MRLLPALLASMIACAAAAAEEVSLAVGADPSGPGSVLVTAQLVGADRPRLLATLSEGLEATVRFELRLYKKTGGIFSLLGDRLLAQTAVARRASMDFLDDRYILLEEGGETRVHSGADDFVSDFLSVRSLRLPWPSETGTYLIARARLEYVRLEPPLHLVTLFRPTAALTGWRRVELAGTGRQR